MDLYTRLPVRELERHSATHPDHIIECQVGVLTWGSSLAAVKGTTKSFELRRDPDYKTLQDAVKEVWNHMRNLNVTTEGINKSKQVSQWDRKHMHTACQQAASQEITKALPSPCMWLLCCTSAYRVCTLLRLFVACIC